MDRNKLIIIFKWLRNKCKLGSGVFVDLGLGLAAFPPSPSHWLLSTPLRHSELSECTMDVHAGSAAWSSCMSPQLSPPRELSHSFSVAQIRWCTIFLDSLKGMWLGTWCHCALCKELDVFDDCCLWPQGISKAWVRGTQHDHCLFHVDLAFSKFESPCP